MKPLHFGARRVGIQVLLMLLALMPPHGVWAREGASAWQPDRPRYGYGMKKDLPVRMDDGIRGS